MPYYSKMYSSTASGRCSWLGKFCLFLFLFDKTSSFKWHVRFLGYFHIMVLLSMSTEFSSVRQKMVIKDGGSTIGEIYRWGLKMEFIISIRFHCLTLRRIAVLRYKENRIIIICEHKMKRKVFAELPTSFSHRVILIIGLFLLPRMNFYTPGILTSVSLIIEILKIMEH